MVDLPEPEAPTNAAVFPASEGNVQTLDNLEGRPRRITKFDTLQSEFSVDIVELQPIRVSRVDIRDAVNGVENLCSRTAALSYG
jgi:adenylosuccinate synthase